MGRRAPETPAQRRGTAVHAEIERYLLTGSWDAPLNEDEREVPYAIAFAGAEFLVPYREMVAAGNADVEHDIGRTTLGPVRFKGRIDLRVPNAPVPSIVDHKTTSDLHAFWHLDEAGMRDNLQLLLYALYGLPEDAPTVRVGHIYYQAKKPYRARELHVTVDRAHLRAAKDRAIGYAERAFALRDIAEQDEVPTKRATCAKFGGCPHAQYCSASPVNEASRAKALAFKLPNIKPSVKKEGSVPLFNRTKVTDSFVTAPGQIAPPDAPAPSPPPAKLAPDADLDKPRLALFEAFGPGAQVMRSAAERMIDAIGYDGRAVVGAGHGLGWWTLRGDGPGETLTLAGKPAEPVSKPVDVPRETPAPLPSPAASVRRKDDPVRLALIAEIEAAIEARGQETVDRVLLRCGVRQFRKAGNEALHDVASEIRRLPSPDTLLPSANNDAAVILDGLDKHPRDAPIVVVTIEEDFRELCGDAYREQRLIDALEHGEKQGWWTVDGEDIGNAVLRRGTDPRPPPPAETPAPPVKRAAFHVEHTTPAKTQGTGGPVVLAGCLPLTGGSVLVDTWLAPVVDQLEAERGDLRLIDYAAGPRVLASAVKVALRAGALAWPADPVHVPAFHPWANELIPVLHLAGATVIVGVR